MAPRKTLDDMQALAEKMGGKCVSEEYLGHKKHLLWQCGTCGLIWKAWPTKIQQGHWCPVCSRKAGGLKNRKYSIEDARKVAEQRGGECLSENMDLCTEKLHWKCGVCGHEWNAIFHSVRRGCWCPKCAELQSANAKRGSLEEFQKLALERGGKCLSTEYVNQNTKLLWECANGHRWEAVPGSVKAGAWCRECTKLTTEQAEAVAEERGGRLLSEEQTSGDKLRWECANGHTFEATLSNVLLGRWCPHCASGYGERLCRLFFEQMFGEKFPKVRPEWLKNELKNNIELDGYCEKLKLAFEHQGIQHYKISRPFVCSKSQLKKLKQSDLLKKKICREHGVVLIRIPSVPDILPIVKLKEFVKKRLLLFGYPVPHGYDSAEFNPNLAYLNTKIQILKDIAQSRGGDCLSTHYLGAHEKHTWICEHGHIWEAEANNVKRGAWCPECYNQRRAERTAKTKLN